MPFVLGDPTQTLPEIHVGDEGTQFISTIYNQNSSVVDLSAVVTITFRFESPSNASVDKTGVLYTDGTDGKCYYTLENGLITESGEWRYQVILTFASGVWSTNVIEFTVYPNITAPEI